MRAETWPAILDAWLVAARARPFVWGEWDCCLAVCDLVRDMTGIDPAAWFRGRYSDEAGAYRLLREFAGGGVPETWRKLAQDLGFPELRPLQAQRGDVALMIAENGPTLAVCVGSRLACVAPPGVAFRPLRDAVAAWRI